jgi:hypothetical protein
MHNGLAQTVAVDVVDIVVPSPGKRADLYRR